MAEVIGLVSSLIGIIQIAGQVAVLTHGYIGGVRRASQDISSLVDELSSLSKVLSALKDYVEAKPNSLALLKLNGPNGPLQGCVRELEALQAKLAPRDGFKGILDNLKWPLKEAETQGYVAQFERHKTLFTLALTVDHITLSKEIEAYVQTTTVLVQDIWTESGYQKAWRLKFDQIRLAEKREKVLNWASPKDFEKKNEDKHLDTSRLRHEDTGKWLLMTPEIRDMAKKNTDSSLLWGFGIPGAGKTFLSSVVIDHFMEESNTKNYGVAYIYFEYKERELQTPPNILRSLVRQLISQIPKLPVEIEALHDKLEISGKSPKFEDLYSALGIAFKAFDQVFLIFDALDECDPKNQRKELLPLFHRMKKSGASLFITSRQYPEDIQESFNNSAKIELSPKEEDIGVFLQQKIGGDARTKRLVRQARCEDRIVSEIISSSQGMFLLARFNIDYICQQPTAKKVLIALDKIKSSSTKDRPLDPTYDRAMETLQSQSEDCVDMGLLILAWLVKANRTLTVEEARVAIAIEAGRYELDELDLPDNTTMLDVCAGLVIIDETSNTMKLAHYTVQEYLLSKSIIPPDADFKLAAACITFLTFDIFSEGPCTSDVTLKARLESQPFLNYAVYQLSYHLSACDEDLTTDMVLKFLEDTGKVTSYVQLLYYAYDDEEEAEAEAEAEGEEDEDGDENENENEEDEEKGEGGEGGEGVENNENDDEHLNSDDDTTIEPFENYPKEHNALHVVAALGHRAALEILLAQGVDISIPNSCEQTLLHLAAAGGHEDVVELLLENGFETSAVDAEGGTPLHDAASEGHEAVVRLLLKHGADLSAQTMNGSTPLSQAALQGNTDVVRLLLESGADYSVSDNNGETPLHFAAAWSYREIFRMLLEKGADFTALDNDGETALHEAAWKGDEELVKLLLEKGADTSIQDKRGITALGNAVSCNHIAVVRLLLEKGSEVSVAGNNGETPLHIAVAGGFPEVTFLLLEFGADVTVTDNEGDTPLHEICVKGGEVIAEAFIAKGANVSAANNLGYTPLQNAVLSGHVGIIKLLLEAGADHTVTDENGLQPLQSGAHDGDVEIVRLLLDHGADISARDNDGMTAVHQAAGEGHKEVLHLLFERGADYSIGNNLGEPPLQYAAVGGHIEAAQILLERGVDINFRDKDGESALHAAVRGGQEKFVKFALENGADVSCIEKGGKSALNRAAKGGELEIVQLLLEGGADISNQNKRGNTPLHHAAGAGHEVVTQFLLDKGADFSVKNVAGETALDRAVSEGHSSVAALLEAIALKQVKIM